MRQECFCFIILHYLSVDMTAGCITAIKQNCNENVRIIIVDNGSENGSYEELVLLYSKDEQVTILKNQDNLGFAKGNNVGYIYAKKVFNPKFMVFLNNDVEICDPEFCEKVLRAYERDKFFILGPDIYSTKYKVHQNPKMLSHVLPMEVKKLRKKYSFQRKQFLYLIVKSLLKSYLHLEGKKYILTRKKIDSLNRVNNVPLHGAIFVCSDKYIKENDCIFYGETFMYFEMEILDYICYKRGYKTVYDPDIKAIHHQGSATNLRYQKMLDKTKFSYDCNIESLGVFLQISETLEEKREQ